MSAERFSLDTNILVYSIDSGAGLRGSVARSIVTASIALDCWVSIQALSEFYVVATRKGVMPRADAAAQVEDWLELFQITTASPKSVRKALAEVGYGQTSYWDALLVATIAEVGCTSLLTEDMGDGTTVQGVKILNPFGQSGLSAAASTLLMG